MPDLIARDKDKKEYWRHSLPSEPITLGRDPEKSTWAVPWDQRVSGLHALLHWNDCKLLVKRLPSARNPIYFDKIERDEFDVAIGERFIIGKTEFVLQQTVAENDRLPPVEQTINASGLKQIRYADADERMEAIAALPGLIRFSPSERELEGQVVEVLLNGIPRAETASVVRLPPATSEKRDMEVRSAKARYALVPPAPSRKLVGDAITTRQNILHVWQPGNPGTYTESDGCEWAVCVPLLDAASPGYGLYVSGRILEATLKVGGPSRDELMQSDMKFVWLTAEVFGALRQVRDMQTQQVLLKRFLSQPVLQALAAQSGRDPSAALKPRETDVTVLFCDLRGSCRIAEDESADLFALWHRVGEALNIMASSIADLDGVIGDFQGDAAMGFWGWPLPCNDRAERAAQAALNIRRRFAQAARDEGHPLSGFECGVGIASGRAIAGRLGTPDQFKVDVFGPVVNLASRLEAMTKHFKVPILADEATVTQLSKVRHRRVARVRPEGMRNCFLVTELLHPAANPDAMPEPDRMDYHAALDAFLAGRWDHARKLLQRLPGDGASRVLLSFMKDNPNGPAKDWDGAIALGK